MVAAGVQINDDHVVQKKMLTTLWTKKRADVLQLLQMYLPPTENFVHAAVQHIRQAMPCVGATIDTRLFVSALATEDEVRHLWKAEAGAPPVGSAEAGAEAMEGLDDGERATRRLGRGRACGDGGAR